MTATGSPTWRTTSRASTGWAQARPFCVPPYAVGMVGAISPRSAALQAMTTPGKARATAVTTVMRRAEDSALRTTPRRTTPSRVRSSTNRPCPVRRRWSSFRRGEAPIMCTAIYHAHAGLGSARLFADGARGGRQARVREADVDAAPRQPPRRVAHVVLLPVRRLHGGPVPGGDLPSGDRVLRRRLRHADRARDRVGLALGAPPRARGHGGGPRSRDRAPPRDPGAVHVRRAVLRRLDPGRSRLGGPVPCSLGHLHAGAFAPVGVRHHVRSRQRDRRAHLLLRRASVAPRAPGVLPRRRPERRAGGAPAPGPDAAPRDLPDAERHPALAPRDPLLHARRGAVGRRSGGGAAHRREHADLHRLLRR